jgi:hypothetical protein
MHPIAIATIALTMLYATSSESKTANVKASVNRTSSGEQVVSVEEIIQLQRLHNGGTRMVSSMVGWGTGDDWDKAVAFFAIGNEWTYRNLATCVAGGRPSLD